MATDSFTASALVTTVGTVGLIVDGNLSTAFSEVTPTGFFLVKKTKAGLTVTKASTLTGAQSALTFPLTRQQGVELGAAILRACN